MAGLTMAGIANFTFGLLNEINDVTTFTVMCFIIRFFESFGATSFFTGSFTIIIEVFQEDVGTTFVSHYLIKMQIFDLNLCNQQLNRV